VDLVDGDDPRQAPVLDDGEARDVVRPERLDQVVDRRADRDVTTSSRITCRTGNDPRASRSATWA
jgi:hypothetical protein